MSSQFQHIQLRRDTKAKLDSHNPILKHGEPAFAVDFNELKIGNGISAWRDLPIVGASRVTTVLVDLPAIQSNTSHTVTVTVAGIDSNDEYSILVAPEVSIPDYIDIRYAHVSADNSIDIVFTNIDNSTVDGNTSSNFSTPTSNVKLHLLINIINPYVEPTTTTTTPPPIIEDVYSFGQNDFGQLAQGDKKSVDVPKLVYDGGKKWTDFAAGHYHGLGISNTKKLYSVGYNYYGQLGLGDKGVGTNRTNFTPIERALFQDGEVFASGLDLVSNTFAWGGVSCGSQFSLALSNSGQLFSCGDNTYGELGLGDKELRTEFTLSGDQAYYYNITDDAAREFLLTRGGVRFFTLNSDQTQAGVNKHVLNKTQEAGTDKFSFITPTGVTNLGTIPSTSGVSLQINGDTTLDDGVTPTVTITGTLNTTINGYDYYYGNVSIDVSGNYGTANLLGIGDGVNTTANNILRYERNVWKTVSAGSNHSVGVVRTSGTLERGELYSWGNNSFGQLGQGLNHNEISTSPQKVLGYYRDDNTQANYRNIESFNDRNLYSSSEYFHDASAGGHHSIGISASVVPTSGVSGVFGFGDNQYGQLALGSENHVDVPTKIFFDFSKIDDANFSDLTSESDIQIQNIGGKNYYVLNYADGKSYNGLERFVLGKGNYIIKGVPDTHPIAILNGGKESAISYNGDTRVGCTTVYNTTADGEYEFYYGDVYVNVTNDFDKVSIYCLYHGYMGGENILFYETPRYNIEDAKCGLNHTILKTDTDQIITFGRNHKGQLGVGDNINRHSPYRITKGDIDKIEAGGDHSFLMDNTRSLWCFGDNDHGQLGLGDKLNRDVPTRLDSDILWENIYADGNFSYLSVFCFYPNPVSDVSLKNADTSSVVGHRQLLLQFSHPTAYEEALTNYVIELSEDGGTNWTTYDNLAFGSHFGDNDSEAVENGIFQYVIDGLDNTKTYKAKVTGVNKAGSGLAVQSSNQVSPKGSSWRGISSAEQLFYSHLDENDLGDKESTYTTTTSFFTNAPRYLDGKCGEALRLYRHDSIEFNTLSSVPQMEQFTLEFFFNPRNYAEANSPLIMLRDNTYDYLRLQYEGTDATGYSIEVYDSGDALIMSTPTMTFGGLAPEQEFNSVSRHEDYSHIAVIRNSGATPNPSDVELVKLYHNGTLVASGIDNTVYNVTNILVASGDTPFYDFDIDELSLASGDYYNTFNIRNFSNTILPQVKPFGE